MRRYAHLERVALDRPLKLSRSEIGSAFREEADQAQSPPILSLKQLAKLTGKSPKTLYGWIEKGRLDGAFRKRGKSMLFWRDKVIEILFNGPSWPQESENE